MGIVVGFITLEQQALFAPDPAWEAAARQLLAREEARRGHAAAGEEGE